MLLASDIGLRGFVLVEGIEVLFESLVGGDPSVDCATNFLRSSRSTHDAVSFDSLSRSPKNRGLASQVVVEIERSAGYAERIITRSIDRAVRK